MTGMGMDFWQSRANYWKARAVKAEREAYLAKAEIARLQSQLQPNPPTEENP